MDPKPIRLTATVKKGGCAAKLPAGELREILKTLKLPRLPELKVGTELMDDACLWDLGNGQYLVQTLDFFTPIVDDARDFGAIAAANAMSDVYAMGGEPRIALTILAFPASTLPMALVSELLEGAVTKIAEAGACLAGGHSIDDETLKLGFSVTGFVDAKRAWTNQGAQPGDTLILTKGLGTGTLMTALKLGELSAEFTGAAIESMKLLNRTNDLIGDVSINAATDITGFGLAGHAMQMAVASRCTFEIETQRLPALPGALKMLGDDYLNRAHKTNRDYTEKSVTYQEVDAATIWLTVDPQTSGGLLLSLPEEDAEKALQLLQPRFPLASIIGRVVPEDPYTRIRFKGTAVE
ncbi:selenide, water dikinase SelD [Bdellovibrionota bacterium FG-1]